MKVILDGKCVNAEDAKIGVTDRGLLCGDGVFTTIQVKEGKPLFLEDHLARIERHSIALHITPAKIDPDWVQEVISANMAQTGVWRLRIYVTGGSGTFPDMTPRSHGHILVLIRPYEPHMEPPCKLKVYPYPIERPHAHVKSLAYLDRYWIRDYTRSHKCDETIVLTSNGTICETAYANIFWIHNGTLFSPDPLLPIIHGITLKYLIEAAKKLGLSVERVRMKLSEIPKDAHIYICNVMIGFYPVERIEDLTFPLDSNEEERLRYSYESFVK